MTNTLSPKWCDTDEPHAEHTARNEFGFTNYCSGRPAPEPAPEVAPSFDLVTPCHGAPLRVGTTTEGSGHLSRDVPDTISCTANGCFNEWDATGKSDGWYKDADA